jgi:RNA recognition motif-containing protein
LICAEPPFQICLIFPWNRFGIMNEKATEMDDKKGKNMGKQLYVTNISFQATEDDIRRMFSVAGTVRSVKLLTDLQTGKFKGCGFVEMATAAEAKEAIETLDEVLLIDRLLTVVEARPSKPKERSSGGSQRTGKSGKGFGAGMGPKPKERPSRGARGKSARENRTGRERK